MAERARTARCARTARKNTVESRRLKVKKMGGLVVAILVQAFVIIGLVIWLARAYRVVRVQNRAITKARETLSLLMKQFYELAEHVRVPDGFYAVDEDLRAMDKRLIPWDEALRKLEGNDVEG